MQENKLERQKQMEVATQAAEIERKRRLDEIAEAAEETKVERAKAWHSAQAAAEEERARRLKEIERHHDIEVKERRRRRELATRQLNDQQTRAPIQHKHNVHRMQQCLSRNIMVI
jgi:hypothetical protein